MQQQLGVNPNPARVHVEGGATNSNNDEREAAQEILHDEEPQDPGAWTGRIVQQLSGVWGYAVIGSAFNLALVTGLSSLEWTNWGGDGAEASNVVTSSSASQVESQSVPKYNKWTMGVFVSLVWPVVFSLRMTFAVAATDPEPLPDIRWQGWRYDPHCFIFMLISTLVVAGFLYILPISLGAQMHYYFADAVSIILQMSVCVVFTARVMQFFYRRDRQQGDDEAVQEQSQNESGDENQEDDEERKDFDCFAETVRNLNQFVLAAVAAGC
tara:strand:+ start:1209 stop:2015 length:807 start_codon:yes stop_codon:yes gene_type:complete